MEKKELEFIIDKLEKNSGLKIEEYLALVEGYSPQLAQYAAKKAVRVRQQIYGNKIFIRGLTVDHCMNGWLKKW